MDLKSISIFVNKCLLFDFLIFNEIDNVFLCLLIIFMFSLTNYLFMTVHFPIQVFISYWPMRALLTLKLLNFYHVAYIVAHSWHLSFNSVNGILYTCAAKSITVYMWFLHLIFHLKEPTCYQMVVSGWNSKRKNFCLFFPSNNYICVKRNIFLNVKNRKGVLYLIIYLHIHFLILLSNYKTISFLSIWNLSLRCEVWL